LNFITFGQSYSKGINMFFVLKLLMDFEISPCVKL